MASLSTIHPGNIGGMLGGNMVQSALPSSARFRVMGYALPAVVIGLAAFYFGASALGVV